MEALAIRLLPGDDLKARLDSLAAERNFSAACVLSCAGSLSRAVIRFAGQAEPEIFEGSFEIATLSGTLGAESGSHLHVAISDQNGKTLGGHLKEGSTVRTTAEVVIGTLPGIRFSRETDPSTGHRELLIEAAS